MKMRLFGKPTFSIKNVKMVVLVLIHRLWWKPSKKWSKNFRLFTIAFRKIDVFFKFELSRSRLVTCQVKSDCDRVEVKFVTVCVKCSKPVVT